MEILNKYMFLFLLLLFSGCGESSSSGKSSSFSDGDSAPVINTIETENNKENFPVTGEDIEVFIKENKREAFKVYASDKSNMTFYLTGGDFHYLQVDPKRGEVFFNEPTDYEKKSQYQFKVGVRDSVGHETEQKVSISILDTKNENEPVQAIESTHRLKGEERNFFITTWKTDNIGISNDNQIIIPTAGDGYNYSVDWGDGTSSKNLTLDAKHTYDKSGTYQIRISGDFPRIYFGQNADYNFETVENDSRKILSIDQWGTNIWESMGGAFTECIELEGKASDNPNLSKVKDMSTMFAISSFDQNIDNWDIANVENLSMMFFFSSFNQNIGKWDTSSVTDMTGMFSVSNFNQNIDKWDTSKVESMAVMFFFNIAFNQGIGAWDTSNVTEMSLMFSLASSFNQNITQWDTSRVTSTLGMFLGATSFNQNISTWNLLNNNNMSQMFQFATLFNQNLEAWHVSSKTDTTEMFTRADSMFSLPTWYNIDNDIRKREFIVILYNINHEACTLTNINENIQGNKLGTILEFNQNIDTKTLILSSRNDNFFCSEYGRADEFIDCLTFDLEGSKENSCVIGFDFAK